MRRLYSTLMLALTVLLGWQTAQAGHAHDTRVEVWTAQSYDDFYDEAVVEVFLRLHERGYVTVYQITPYGNLEVLYPRPHHDQRELRPNRIYRLHDLADDIYLYDEEEGEVQIGVIFTPEPVVVSPWLERSFVEAGLVFGRNKIIYAHVDFPRIFARVEADIRIHLGPRCRPAFVRTPVYVRPRFVYRGGRWDHGYHKPRPDYKKRDHGKRGYEPPYSRKQDEPAEPKRRGYEKSQAEVRPVTFPARPPAREQDPVTKAPAQRSRRERLADKPASNRVEERASNRVDESRSNRASERNSNRGGERSSNRGDERSSNRAGEQVSNRETKEASKQMESRDEEKRTSSARRTRSARSED